MLREVSVFLFVVAAGFTLSGIVSNVYRLVAGAQDRFGRTAYYAALVVAGPSVLMEKAAKALREKRCSHFSFWLAVALCGYWSFALGLFALGLILAI